MRIVETTPEIEEAVNKQRPTPIIIDKNNSQICPKCGKYLAQIRRGDYCTYCGQKLKLPEQNKIRYIG